MNKLSFVNFYFLLKPRFLNADSIMFWRCLGFSKKSALKIITTITGPYMEGQIKSLEESERKWYCASPVKLTDGKWDEGREWGMRQIIRPQESLVHCK